MEPEYAALFQREKVTPEQFRVTRWWLKKIKAWNEEARNVEPKGGMSPTMKDISDLMIACGKGMVYRKIIEEMEQVIQDYVQSMAPEEE